MAYPTTSWRSSLSWVWDTDTLQWVKMTQPGASAGGLTNAELRATPVPVSFTATDFDIRDLVFATDKVDVSGSTGVGVTGTFWPATQPISAAALPLPAGAATSALQLPDSHNVTIDNASGGAAVNIQDGGNSITIDGTVSIAKSATAAQTSVSVLTSNTVILAANASRRGATIYNESGATAYVKLGTTAALTSYTIQIGIGGYYEVPFDYTGGIDGITAAITAVTRVTELSA